MSKLMQSKGESAKVRANLQNFCSGKLCHQEFNNKASRTATSRTGRVVGQS